MTITMQGSWTLRVKSREAAFAQRFIVSGATSGNGTYDGIVGNSVLVTGAQWSLRAQHRPGRRPWCDSTQRIGLPSVEDGVLRVDIGSNDGGLDVDYDDLVLACSLPVSQTDYVVYGAVTTYAGPCPFNPCRDDYIVIDPPCDLGWISARYPRLIEVIRKLYPERARGLRGAGFDRTPLVIPSGLPNVAVGLLFESHELQGVELACDERAMVRNLQTVVKRVPFKAVAPGAGADRLSASDLAAIDDARDAALRMRCGVKPAPGLRLRFQHYKRTGRELASGPYTGAGLREDLGGAVSDAEGHYIFRFRRERTVASRPDLIVQVLSAGQGICFESAPYDQVANMRRIDLCVPHAQVHASQVCADDRVIRRLGGGVAAAPNLHDMADRVSVSAVSDVGMRRAA